ncbi:phenylacetate--CoA ligase [Solirubrobacter ginsenosidimutans]|uniref:Phenylacetate-coenzyme A ligase n=1 Tax=Solirubrobacter ginsenosidimutans TaxID=490573 RepID=A0A9X3MQB3_9ACTN|nr:phenylacetate--CoA ligase [Solirubrobacter ginsenosidimutans]MDA0160699.1 phenylacetate--CoA ligase [Solirubrobacter ginsenosidimutans]
MSVRIEHAPRTVLETLQLERLQQVVARLKRTERGADLPDIESLDDLQNVPFTTKDDLRAGYPLGLITVPREQLRRIHASSGTGGVPTVVAYTEHDLDVWSKVMSRCMAMAGVKAGMIVHNAYGYGLFTGGLGFHQGAERLGALVIPVSGGVTARQATLLRDLQGQVLCCTPSYALHIAQGLREAGIDRQDLKLEIGMFGAEPWTEGMRERLQDELGLIALNVYGLSEIVGPGVSAECPEARDGLHVQEDHFLVEVIDPATGRRAADGTDGELVFTTLTKEALPLIRYRTGDIASLTHERCACGRTFARMSAVRGRRDDMLIIRGVNLYPSQIEHVLLGQAGVAPHYQLVVERPETLDEVTVCCEPLEAGVNPIALATKIEQAIRERIGVSVTVHVKAPGEIPRSEGKAVRVIDRR